jgi:pimeloyl-ACP methyl ester carboxylesterase
MRRLILALILVLPFALDAQAASVDGIKINSAATGKGPTLIFVHGWTCDSSSWDAQVPEFAKNYRVITLDLPGHGKSGLPQDGKFSVDLFAKAVEAVRAEAGADKVVLIGHSMGAPVIRQYAHNYPSHVAGLVAVDGPLDMRAFGPVQPGQGPPQMTGAEGLKAREGMIRGMFVATTPVPLQKHIMDMMLGAPETTANGAMAAMFDPSIRWSDKITAPSLLVAAGTARAPDAAASKDVLPNFEATQVPGTGHFLMMEKPDEFNRLLAGFLDKIHFR